MKHPRMNGHPVSLRTLADDADWIGAQLDAVEAAHPAGGNQAAPLDVQLAALRARRGEYQRIADWLASRGGSARRDQGGQPARVRHMGVTVTCTAGLGLALRTWASKARRIADSCDCGCRGPR